MELYIFNLQLNWLLGFSGHSVLTIKVSLLTSEMIKFILTFQAFKTFDKQITVAPPLEQLPIALNSNY